MPRVDFYIVDDAGDRARWQLACRLTEKAFSQSHKVCITVDSPEEADALDKLLWTFRDGSFIPHDIAKGDADEPVLIASGDLPAGMSDVLINLRQRVPEGYERFQRVIEPLDGNAPVRKDGRERFKHYRDQGITPESHNLALSSEN